jgi:tripartite-type tricarboxylate transporter receptor subunit TctC
VITRLLAQKLSDHVGKQFYVENMGGGGNIAMRRAAKMAPDGYTLLMVSPSYVINPAARPPMNSKRDFDPMTLAVANILVVAVHLSGAHCPGACRAHQSQFEQYMYDVYCT